VLRKGKQFLLHEHMIACKNGIDEPIVAYNINRITNTSKGLNRITNTSKGLNRITNTSKGLNRMANIG
jgi:hypothetical protein